MAGKASILSYRKGESEGSDDDLGLPLEKLNLGPRKKLLVISPNGVLVHRTHIASRHSTIPKDRMPDAVYGGYLVFKRPFAQEFIRMSIERFEVGIWSSAKERNATHVLDCAMGEMKNKLLFVWDQDECTDSGFKSLEKKEKPLLFKELKRVWEKMNKNNNTCPFNASNTLLIDDRPYKALLNPPDTAIFPHTYNPKDANDEALNPEGELGKYLGGLVEADDVQDYVKKNSFGQPAVTLTHPDWGFYNNVIRHLQRD